jgi:hypothetical protein
MFISSVDWRVLRLSQSRGMYILVAIKVVA